jgi:hypothetical protein
MIFIILYSYAVKYTCADNKDQQYFTLDNTVVRMIVLLLGVC